ncbi:cyclophilin-like family protein [Natrialbaceae archaeon A-CW3]
MSESSDSDAADLVVAVDDHRLEADWLGDAPATRDAIADALPLSDDAARWGEELYIPIPVDVPAENARAEVPVGALAYWPAGNALCLFWGATPASEGDEPRAASPVNVFARVRDVSPLAELEDGGARLGLERR